MEELQQPAYAEDEINLGDYFAALHPHWWKIVLLSLAVGILTFLLLFFKPNLYKATAIITPAGEEGKKNAAFGVLATFGIAIGGPTKAEDLEALFNSNDLAVRVFDKYNLWPIVFPKDFDPRTGKLKVGWKDRLSGIKEDWKFPADWDAIRAAKDMLFVSVNRKSGTLTLSFESPSPEGSANIVRYYLEEAKSRLQEEELSKATQNKKFLESQIAKTVDALTRDRLYTLFGQETEKEMLARNREQFAFRVIDAPRVPDRKTKPKRIILAAMGILLSFMIFTFFFAYQGKKRDNPPRPGRQA